MERFGGCYLEPSMRIKNLYFGSILNIQPETNCWADLGDCCNFFFCDSTQTGSEKLLGCLRQTQSRSEVRLAYVGFFFELEYMITVPGQMSWL